MGRGSARTRRMQRRCTRHTQHLLKQIADHEIAAVPWDKVARDGLLALDKERRINVVTGLARLAGPTYNVPLVEFHAFHRLVRHDDDLVAVIVCALVVAEPLLAVGLQAAVLGHVPIDRPDLVPRLLQDRLVRAQDGQGLLLRRCDVACNRTG